MFPFQEFRGLQFASFPFFAFNLFRVRIFQVCVFFFFSLRHTRHPHRRPLDQRRLIAQRQKVSPTTLNEIF
ncbi:hypothetical protein L596_023889 [Steinernema carpocapsae]|uniref:Uncharacterized protein n=1 Tax=Steinernema carpocapsae TaxID=34508 RepID=A0A4V5ZZJ4_STECR|nr:hypothetical protein L596_023889 [Steinernema carpocapsae]